MHEHGIASRLLEVVLERASAAGARRVSDVFVEIGDESDVTHQALEHYWPEISAGTPADGARLVFGRADDPWACRVVAIEVPDPLPEPQPG
jgi:hydrogenase nickel incorporation protein HypA/HybF